MTLIKTNKQTIKHHSVEVRAETSSKEGLKTNGKEHVPIVDDGPKVPCTTSLSGNCTRSTPVLYLNIASCTRHNHHLSCYSGSHKTVG